MGKPNIVVCFLLLICAVIAKERLEFVFQYNSAAERTPLYKDQYFNITRNNYGQGPNMITLTGLRNSFSQGEKFRSHYTNDHPYFLSPRYDPTEYFIRTFTDNPSIMSAYSFMLGAHPEQVEGLGLIRESDDKPPLQDAHIDDARRALYLDRPEDKAKPIYIHTGNADGFFFRNIKKMYPGLEKDFNENMKRASSEFESRYGDELYKRLAFSMGRNIGDLNFDSVAPFLDDYISAFANGKSTSPFNFNEDTMDLISRYYYFLIHQGLLRDPALNKVIAHPFLYSLLREILFKAQDYTDIARWEGPCVTSKVSLAFGNRLTYLAALRTLDLDDDVTYNPGWGDQLTFELYQEAGEWFVRIYNNNELVRSISRDGKIPLEQFKTYVCTRLYYGDMDAVEAGYEDYHKKAQIKGNQCKSLTQVVPLFGCTLKKEYNYDQSGRSDLGWTQNELRKNDNFRQYGGRAPTDDSLYFIKAKQNSGYSYSYNYGTNSNGYANTEDNLMANNAAGGYDTTFYGGNNGYQYSYNSGDSYPNNRNIYSDSYGSDNMKTYGTHSDTRNQQGNDFYSANQGNYVVAQPNTNQNNYYSNNYANNQQTIPVTVEHQTAKYVVEEQCDLLTPVPPCKKEFNLFRANPVVVKQRQSQTQTVAPVQNQNQNYNTQYSYNVQLDPVIQPTQYNQQNQNTNGYRY